MGPVHCIALRGAAILEASLETARAPIGPRCDVILEVGRVCGDMHNVQVTLVVGGGDGIGSMTARDTTQTRAGGLRLYREVCGPCSAAVWRNVAQMADGQQLEDGRLLSYYNIEREDEISFVDLSQEEQEDKKAKKAKKNKKEKKGEDKKDKMAKSPGPRAKKDNRVF